MVLSKTLRRPRVCVSRRGGGWYCWWGGSRRGGLGYGGDCLTVLGQYGVTVTPAYLAMYGLCGASMVSLFPAIFGLADTTVMAVDDVAVQAILGTVNITGGSEVSIRAHGPDGIEIVSKGKPKLKYTGIPNLLAPSAHRPVSIRGNEVSVQAVDSILLRVGKIQNGLVTGLNAPTVMLSSEGIISSIGDLSLELRKDEFKLTVGKQVLKIDKNGINLVGEKIEAKAGDSEMTLSKKAAIQEQGNERLPIALALNFK